MNSKKYQCYLVSVRNRHDTIDFEADSYEEATKMAEQKLGISEWACRFNRETDDVDAMEGLQATYISHGWTLYIHDKQNNKGGFNGRFDA